MVLLVVLVLVVEVAAGFGDGEHATPREAGAFAVVGVEETAGVGAEVPRVHPEHLAGAWGWGLGGGVW